MSQNVIIKAKKIVGTLYRSTNNYSFQFGINLVFGREDGEHDGGSEPDRATPK